MQPSLHRVVRLEPPWWCISNIIIIIIIRLAIPRMHSRAFGTPSLTLSYVQRWHLRKAPKPGQP